MKEVNILWFRNGLRVHDNGSLANAMQDKDVAILPLFVFDGQSPITDLCAYNKLAFLLECLEDLDQQFREVKSRLYFMNGTPVDVLKRIGTKFKINRLCFDQDIEPIWLDRDNGVKNYCAKNKISVNENIGATLWDPLEIIEANGGTPPLTYSQFTHVTQGVGAPKRPLETVDLKDVNLLDMGPEVMRELEVFPDVPTPEDLKYTHAGESKVYKGGETRALKFFNKRIKVEKDAFLDGSFLPNKRNPDILNPPKSLSPDFKFGCLSVRKFYWAVMDSYDQANETNPEKPPPSYQIVNQLIWREFFYVMSANNPFYAEMDRNPICINIPWYDDKKALEQFNDAKTGFPFIDAGIRQLKKEGWIHHILRNAISMFLTRGDLWLNWEHGKDLFQAYLIDGDWAVNAGCWMWVSSSAFEKALNYSFSLDPRVYGRRIDPHGEYIKKFIPELKNYPVEFIYEPWKASKEVQEAAGCVIGKDYPAPMVDHDKVVEKNRQMMLELQDNLLKKMNMEQPNHVKPSDQHEIEKFFRINEAES